MLHSLEILAIFLRYFGKDQQCQLDTLNPTDCLDLYPTLPHLHSLLPGDGRSPEDGSKPPEVILGRYVPRGFARAVACASSGLSGQ